MYKVTKPEGNNACVSVTDTDTRSSNTIGRLSREILDILETAGYKTTDYKAEISLEVNHDIASKLCALTMKMSAPIRDQSKKKKVTNEPIDALDVLLGLAKY